MPPDGQNQGHRDTVYLTTGSTLYDAAGIPIAEIATGYGNLHPAGESLLYSAAPFIQAAALPEQKKKPRQVFVAYAYGLYPRSDYRKVFTSIGKAFEVQFVFADEKITDLHILAKIQNYILESQFGIYDISGWNANVTLELGLAFGLEGRAYIAYDPSKTSLDEVPADLRGLDRMQYSSYSELEEKVSELIGQELPLPRRHEAENQLSLLRERTIDLVRDASTGLKIGDIAKGLGITTQLAQLVVRPLVGAQLRTTGAKRGTRYVAS